MGLTFLLETAYLLPLTLIFIAISVGALGFRVSRRRGYGPFLVGIVASIVLVLGKFVFESDVAVYGAVVGLIGASLWNSWPRKSVPPAPAEPLLQLGSIRREKHGYETQG
jgi:mercuric ion transport protein